MGRYAGWNKADLTSKLKASITQAKANKYHAVKKTVDGITFHSTKEANRYKTLKALNNAHVIKNLTLQLRVPLHVNGVLVCTWICDFFYTDQRGNPVWEDTKGKRTEGYIIKKKLFEAVYGVKIRES